MIRNSLKTFIKWFLKYIEQNDMIRDWSDYVGDRDRPVAMSINQVSIAVRSQNDSNIPDSQLANFVAHTLEFLHYFFKTDEMDTFLRYIQQQYERAGKTQEYRAVIDDIVDILQGKYTHLPPLPGKQSPQSSQKSNNIMAPAMRLPPADRLPELPRIKKY